MFNNMALSIRHKLYFSAFAIALSLLSIAVFAYYEADKVQTLFRLNQMLENSEKQMLHLRKDEKDFLSRHESRYVDTFEADFEELIADLNYIIQSPLIRSTSPDISDQITHDVTSLQTYLTYYRQNFLQVVELQEQIGLTEKQGLRGELRDAVHNVENSIKAINSSQLEAAMLTLRRNEKDFLLRVDLKYYERHTANMERFMTVLNSASVAVVDRDRLVEQLKVYQVGFQSLVDKMIKIGLTADQGVLGEMRDYVHQTEAAFDVVRGELHTLEDEFFKDTAVTLGIMLTLCIGFGVGMITFIAVGVSRRIGVVANQLRKIAEGSANLAQRLDVKGRDEIADLSNSFNRFIGKLQGEFSGIEAVSINLTSTAEANSQLTSQARDNASQQQAESSQAAVAAQQMAATAQEMAVNIEDTAKQTEVVQTAVSEGHAVVRQTRNSIEELNKVILESGQSVGSVREQSSRIDSVVDVIRDIAEQTNLLALNAAIEAARAGESGRGFAVVADEVRGLAQRTRGSTEEIQSLVEELRTRVQSAVLLMEQSNEFALKGADSTAAAESALEKIHLAVDGIVSMSAQIAAGSTEQAQTADVMGQNIAAISGLANATLETINQVDQEGDRLADKSSELSSIVHRYI